MSALLQNNLLTNLFSLNPKTAIHGGAVGAALFFVRHGGSQENVSKGTAKKSCSHCHGNGCGEWACSNHRLRA
jgi:hypothetical protein